ncbi:hypothetical protein DFH11DRAFT_1505841 [Phellopilus nigrolimitatus]|nr:hypothetical protein DFH11DRAFT_1505841 [Phellopilus nigrolimitatus]
MIPRSTVLVSQGRRIIRPARAGHKLGRFYSSPVSAEQEAALDHWIQQAHTAQHLYHDGLSSSKVADLYCTLPTRDAAHAPPDYEPLQPLHSLVFFHARTPEAQLGVDQTDTDFCPPPPFTRRMWAGGAFRFPPTRSLCIGPAATAAVSIAKIEKKGFEQGTPMVFVHQKIDYRQYEARPRMSEDRIHVYLPREARADRRETREVTGLPEPQYNFTWTPTPTTLFRFSALTWNAHLIHLDREYAQNEEGYPERLVHGPLTALMLVEALFHEGYKGGIDNFVYRARNPVVVGRRQHVRGAFDVERAEATLWAEDDDGVVGMTGTVDLLPEL